jgi:hypothetical protein
LASASTSLAAADPTGFTAARVALLILLKSLSIFPLLNNHLLFIIIRQGNENSWSISPKVDVFASASGRFPSFNILGTGSKINSQALAHEV